MCKLLKICSKRCLYIVSLKTGVVRIEFVDQYDLKVGFSTTPISKFNPKKAQNSSFSKGLKFFNEFGKLVQNLVSEYRALS